MQFTSCSVFLRFLPWLLGGEGHPPAPFFRGVVLLPPPPLPPLFFPVVIGGSTFVVSAVVKSLIFQSRSSSTTLLLCVIRSFCDFKDILYSFCKDDDEIIQSLPNFTQACRIFKYQYFRSIDYFEIYILRISQDSQANFQRFR